MQRALRVAVAETDHVELHRRAGLGVSAVATDRQHVLHVLERAESMVADHPEMEVLSVRRRVLRADDL